MKNQNLIFFKFIDKPNGFATCLNLREFIKHYRNAFEKWCNSWNCLQRALFLYQYLMHRSLIETPTIYIGWSNLSLLLQWFIINIYSECMKWYAKDKESWMSFFRLKQFFKNKINIMLQQELHCFLYWYALLSFFNIQTMLADLNCIESRSFVLIN